MEVIFEKSVQKVNLVPVLFVRGLMNEINWDARLIGIKGARGVGKTTLLLQHIKLHFSKKPESVLFANLDDVWFNTNSLPDLAADFVKQGGTHLYLDEVHKYPNWSQALKNIYDDHTSLKIVFTGSSLLEILNARADLSRRAVIYTLQGFSFREYLNFETQSEFEPLSLQKILNDHPRETRKIVADTKPFQHFGNYIKYGYYPFYKEQTDLYYTRLGEVVNMMLEIELPLLRRVDLAYLHKIKQLLSIIAESVPFMPNVSKLSEKIGINRITLLTYFHYLDETGLTRNLFKDATGISKLQKPNKIFLENTNLVYLLARENANKGNLRETFFTNQLGYRHQINYAEKGDFKIDGNYIFEIGGKNKSGKQIQDLKNAFVVADDIEYGRGKKIPLWLFGFLY